MQRSRSVSYTHLDLKVTYKNSGEDAASGKFVLQMIANENDNARKVFYASRLGEGEEILVDGKKDAAYGDTAAFDIATVQMCIRDRDMNLLALLLSKVGKRTHDIEKNSENSVTNDAAVS